MKQVSNMESTDKQRFESWKIQYDQKRKKQRYYFLKPIGWTMLIVLLLSGIFYSVYSEEYKFFFQRTEKINAHIYRTDRSHLGKGVYVQKVFFTYEFENTRYKNSNILLKNTSVKRKGDSLLIKISKSNPDKYKIIGFYN